MKNTLDARRQKLLRYLERLNRKITFTRKNLARIESRIVTVKQPQSRAA